MQKTMMKTGLAIVCTIFLSALLMIPSHSQTGNYLYWGSPTLNTGSVRTGLDFASDALRLEGSSNIRRSTNEVTGSKGDTYVAITCIGTAPRVTAVVMVTGGNNAVTAQTRDQVVQKIKGIIRFD